MKVLIVDDHSLFRAGLALVLKELDQELEIIEASGNEQAQQALNSQNCLDLVILDLNMPGGNGFELIEFITSKKMTLPLVVVSASDDVNDVRKAINAGAMGYIGKHMSSQVMINALRLVLAGEVYIPAFAQNPQPRTARTTCSFQLTPRQLDVLRLIQAGHPNKQIADLLNISEATVKMHVTAIFKELGVSSRTQAILKAQEILSH